MHFTFRNVNEAFEGVVRGISDKMIPTVETPSRNGPVLQIPEPVIVTYENPRERVLFNQVRDCNPFFHLYEALWMLAGRNDVAPLKYYASTIDQFSDDGETFNGAYGYRWRHAHLRPPAQETGNEIGGVDQLDVIVDHLTRMSGSRRAVLQIWNVEDDLLKIGSDLDFMKGKVSKDVCCNLSVMFSIREGGFKELGFMGCEGRSGPPPRIKYLDMTVTNRSNDLIWGMFGANVVHFSFLQEYLACALGVEVGVYNQFSNNAHVYTETNSGWKPDEWLSVYASPRTMHTPRMLSYSKGVGTSQPLFGKGQRELFDAEVKRFVENFSSENTVKLSDHYETSFLNRTALPVCMAWSYYKIKAFRQADEWIQKIAGADWRVACEDWMRKRAENHKRKESRQNAL